MRFEPQKKLEHFFQQFELYVPSSCLSSFSLFKEIPVMALASCSWLSYCWCDFPLAPVLLYFLRRENLTNVNFKDITVFCLCILRNICSKYFQRSCFRQEDFQVSFDNIFELLCFRKPCKAEQILIYFYPSEDLVYVFSCQNLYLEFCL